MLLSIIFELSTLLPARIVFVTVPVSPDVMIVPDLSGTVIVLSAVGFVIASVVSLASSAEPSNTRLFVIVCEPSLFTKLFIIYFWSNNI